MARYRFVIADVFTDVPLQGNQLAVFTDARDIPEHELQRLARETNFSETTFVYPPESDGHIRMRIFTPASEVPFAGHPTLGTAFVLAGPLQLIEIRIETAAGLVPVALEREGAKIVFGRMRQPQPVIEDVPDADALLAALGGVEPQLPVQLYDNGIRHVYVEFPSRDAVAALEPDLNVLSRLSYCVNCFAGEGGSWKTRMFAPGLGVAEDPATGSAAGPLALHLARHGRIGFGDEIELVQGEEIGRRSVLYATAHDEQWIEVGGSAVIVARGEYQI